MLYTRRDMITSSSIVLAGKKENIKKAHGRKERRSALSNRSIFSPDIPNGRVLITEKNELFVILYTIYLLEFHDWRKVKDFKIYVFVTTDFSSSSLLLFPKPHEAKSICDMLYNFSHSTNCKKISKRKVHLRFNMRPTKLTISDT